MSEDLILEQFMPYRLARLASIVSRMLAHVTEDECGLSIPEWRVVAVLGRFPGLSAVEVAERTFLDKVAVSRAVGKLIRAGRVDRQRAQADRRRSILSLSPAGRELHDRVATLALAFEKALLDGIDPNEIERFNDVMDRLLARAAGL